MRITKGYLWRETCVYSSDTASISFVLGVVKKSEVPIYSARTSLTYPSSFFCQAGTRTTAGDPWLCKLQRNKHELPVNTPSPNTQVYSSSNITTSQRTKKVFFLTVPVPVDPPQYYWPLLQVSRFLYSLNKRSEAGDFYWLTSYRCQPWLYMRNIVLQSIQVGNIIAQPLVRTYAFFFSPPHFSP